MKSGNIKAQKRLRTIIEREPKNSEALSLLSQVLLLDKKEVEAERALSAAASINSELPSVYRNQARLMLKKSRHEEALNKAILGCKIWPNDPESSLALAACLIANHRDANALPLIEKILEGKSYHAEAYANRAFLKLRAKDIFGAIEDAKKTVSLKPHLTQMWQLLGSLYDQLREVNKAIDALRNAHRHDPNNTNIMVHLAELLQKIIMQWKPLMFYTKPQS